MKITMLGCGPSMGVPAIGPDWGACDPNDPRNRRRRASILIESRGKTVLIDCSPDLREQLLDAKVRGLDAVILTHAHADHLHGIDDMRAVNRLVGAQIPLYATQESLGEIERRFGYVLRPPPTDGFFTRPSLAPHRIDGPFPAAGVPVTPFLQDHGYGTTLGFRIGAFGYSTDAVELDDAAFAALAGIDTWIVDCLRYEPHPTHSHVARTLEWIERVKPRRAILTHMDRPLDYTELAAQLPPGVEPGYDGLIVELPDP
ncbi:MAG TPA: MBL fold metallo-hydrolase [Stellaceae bacterium]|jgi:phosphoribosyl 1,2-cyclic phosphate phosphodiesterase|nr:MBL fold metallo-hydrolase [Stellaceae bacterium]